MSLEFEGKRLRLKLGRGVPLDVGRTWRTRLWRCTMKGGGGDRRRATGVQPLAEFRLGLDAERCQSLALA